MRLCLSVILFALAGHGAIAQSKFDVLPYWNYYQPKPAQTYHLLMEKAVVQLEKRNEQVAEISSEATWAKYRSALRTKMMASLGAFPAKTPLRARVTSTVESDGIWVENVLYESLPGYYVSASFFRKKEFGGKPLPVILFCSGHSENGYKSSAYQKIILNYVKKGFAIFAFDPVGQGERIQYRDAHGKAERGPTHDHSYSGSRAFLLGESPAKYFIWDGIRAIDYLETRNDVDIKRLGIAGRSGGGTQSSYIAAIDERVVAAAPECYITTYDLLLKSKGPQDAEQVFFKGIANGIDIPDLLHLRAPKATLVVTTTNDIFSVQGVHDMKNELSRLYGMVGKKDNFLVVEDNAGHASTKLNREACYRFFSKHLNNPCNTDDEPVVFFEDAQLFASKGGDVFTLPGSKRLDEVIAESAKGKASSVGTESLAKSLNYKPSTETAKTIFSGTLLTRNYSADKYLVKAPAGNYFPVVVFSQTNAAAGREGPVLYLDEMGKAADTTKILKLLERHQQVIAADLSGIGELKEHYNWRGDAYIQGTPLNLWYLAVLTDQTLAQYRLGEIDALYSFIRAKKPGTAVFGMASGLLTTDLLHWATLNRGKLDNLTLLNPILSYRALLGARTYNTAHLLQVGGGMLIAYDLPDLFKQFSPEKLRLINPVNSNGEVLKSGMKEIDASISEKSLKFVDNVLEAI